MSSQPANNVQRVIFYLLLALCSLMLGYWGYLFFRAERSLETEIDHFEAPTPSQIPLGYGGPKNYFSSQNEILRDVARYYNFTPPLEPNKVGLKGVWYVERDKITALSEGSALSILFKGRGVEAAFSGASSLPVRVEVDGVLTGEIQVQVPDLYPLLDLPGEEMVHTLTLYVPRGVSLSTLIFKK